MTRTWLKAAALAVALLAGSGTARAGLITFEGLSEFEQVTTQYAAQGVTFNGNGYALVVPNYNFYGYPPHSGDTVIYDAVGTGIRADFSTLQSSVSIWTVSAITPVTLEAYDSLGNLLASDTQGGTNYGGPNQQLSVSATGIAYVVIHDSGNFYTVDDFQFSTAAAVPEPSLMAMGAAGLAGLAAVRRRFGRKAA